MLLHPMLSQAVNSLLLIISLVSVYGSAFAVSLNAELDRTKVVEGESLTLTLSAKTRPQGGPDLSVLAADFDVIDQAQSTRLSIVNGNASSLTEWQVTIMPKKYGKLRIPAIHWGQLVSSPIDLEVLRADQANANNLETRQVLIETEVSTKNPYVQGQVIYTIRILAKVQMQQPALTQFKVANAMVEKLGEDTSYSKERDGHKYNVIERRYAIFPQRSGLLTIESPILSAVIADPRRRNLVLRDPFFGVPFGDPFGTTNNAFSQQIRMRGPSISLDVKPQDPSVIGVWLPAQKVELLETWNPNPPSFIEGQPTTRTITIMAHGLSAAQIPDLTIPSISNVKFYPDATQADNQARDDNLIGIKTFKQAVVPAVAGRITLPEIRLAWWDTINNQPQLAIIPAQDIEVLPAINADAKNIQPNQNNSTLSSNLAPNLSSKNLPTAAVHPENSAKTDPGNVNLKPNSILDNQSLGYLNWFLTSMILSIAWLTTILLWLIERRRKVRQPKVNDLNAAKLSKLATQIKQYCLANDARLARLALLNWGRANWPDQPPTNLNGLASALNSEIATAVFQELDQCLYAGAASKIWDGRAAWNKLSQLLPNSKPAGSKIQQPLPQLYPNTIG
ncbi:hypothetical protein TI04_01505 [Achromatium sp. WMS2]|nr:hypothetical protein TI04_01505 [Achromatium sp. WMS2]